MKIEHLSATVTELSGHYKNEVEFPDSTKGRIEFSFVYEGEFGTLTVTSGVLVVDDRSSVAFSKSRTTFYTTKIGPVPEDLNYSEIIVDHFAKVSELAKGADVKVEIKSL